VLVLTYLLLMRAFRSLILPLKAVILNLLSVAAAYGALVVVFRFGLGKDVLGLYQFPRGILRLPGRSIVGLQEFGAGLAVAILLDATVVRAVMVPALMAVMGRYNSWLPARVARVVRVQPSPLRAP
jgi:uncharacterized membrane protein YdfJ with MMPL/SSD domain